MLMDGRLSRIRVPVVDDSVVVRRLIAQALESEPQIDAVGTAANGQIALARVVVQPDSVTIGH
jgi:two-component system chemotaxis response regulator CheB